MKSKDDTNQVKLVLELVAYARNLTGQANSSLEQKIRAAGGNPELDETDIERARKT